ncbi:MAG TPA: cytochrome o ubiquinol oxidase subunit IV [Candidatus Paceibacterota bacterium]|jgi:cytochrome o ubiquinol oxidase operon protein cyoD|nr:cytochrome o ubiquinol oxidase subunit IV [Candidatus Paceibacterota bacterium]
MTHETTWKNYFLGFGASCILTILSFFIAARHVELGNLSYPVVAAILLLIAFTQFTVQLVYFLHLGTGKKERMSLAIFLLTLSVVAVIVVGSIWIMNNLNYNMTPQQMDTYSIEQG